MRRVVAIPVFLLACAGTSNSTAPVPADFTLRLQEIAAGLSNPVYLNSPAGDSRLFVVERFTVSASPNVANAASAKVILTVSHPRSNHNGGLAMFGPTECSISGSVTVEAAAIRTSMARTRTHFPESSSA